MMNILLDDASPEITYFSKNDGWVDDHRDGTKYPDPYVSSYSQKTFHKTFTDGDYMQYRFNGTGITLVGSKRKNHGVFGVKIDDEVETFHSGFSNDPVFQTEMYTRNDLSRDKVHLITVTNYPTRTDPQGSSTPDSWMDIDHLIVMHDTFAKVYTTIMEDVSSLISYDSTWTLDTTDTANRDGTTHISNKNGGSVTIPFNGSSIQIFSSNDINYQDYSVSLDDGAEQTYNSNHFETLNQISHFVASGLPEGQHTLKITNRGNTASPMAAFDYAVVNTTISPDSTDNQSKPSLAPTSSASADSSGSKSTNIGAIAGGAAGGVVGLAGVALLAWWLLCRKPRRAKTRPMSYVSYPDSNYNPQSRSTYEVEPKFGRSRMISASTGDSTKVNSSPTDGPSSSMLGSFRGLFSSNRRQIEHEEEVSPSIRSVSPEGSVAYFYTPHPASDLRTNLNESAIESGIALGTVPEHQAQHHGDSFDNQVYRNPSINAIQPSLRPRTRPPISTYFSTQSQSQDSDTRVSPTSRRSDYSQGGDTYFTETLNNHNNLYNTNTNNIDDNRINAIANTNSTVIPLPSPPSQRSSEYEHMPLPPLPSTQPLNMATSSQSLQRPNIIHADASSTLLPPASIRQPQSRSQLGGSTFSTANENMMERPIPHSVPNSTNVSPSSTHPSTPGDYKRSILGLTLDTTPTTRVEASGPNSGESNSSGNRQQLRLNPNMFDVELPILSPPPEYAHVMTSQQEQTRP
ncbi:uncharacterized protein L201_006602 [Kwoniella dendrophila CBS 6074]|uniref:Uncharacterized protein n=1 Tax=Kwoniella dendrophila CBS 6074 TaxID=1295534 RepID=A0AAX4K260_9TREE